MELKEYQKSVLKDIERYARTYALTEDASTAYGVFLNSLGLIPGKDGIGYYHDDLNGIPKVCAKVPTGGGKTFIGVNAIDRLCDILPSHDDVVVWLVPRDAILKQTIRNFRDTGHFLHETLNRDFEGQVKVLTKEDGLAGYGFNANTMGDGLTLFVLSYDSFKTSNADGRKAYRENSALMALTALQKAAGTAVDVEGADDTALISAIAGSNPIVIVDESHHASSSLSIDMLKKMNPRFVLELTATPDPDHANIVAQATARQLKHEQMVKLPVVVYNRNDKRTVIADAVMLQKRLEAIALKDEKRTGRYIRPIVLFQAEPRGDDERETYEKLKKKLVDGGVPEDQIAIRVSGLDELGETDLMSRDCSLRYVITVNALSEGWDCPFAYVLATIANKNSQVSVEQIVGRVLRQPYAVHAGSTSLNTAYVLTSSADFEKTVRQVADGLNGSGFAREDVIAHEGETPVNTGETGQLELVMEPVAGDGSSADGDDIGDFDFHFEGAGFSGSEGTENGVSGDGTGSGASCGVGGSVPSTTEDSVDDILSTADELEQQYEKSLEKEGESTLMGGLGAGRNIYSMRESVAESARTLVLPQFSIEVDGGLFTDELARKPLDREDLLADFKLSRYGVNDVHIDVTAFNDARAVDLMEDSDAYKIRRLQDDIKKNMRQLFNSMSDESKRKSLVGAIFDAMSAQSKSTYGMNPLKDYIKRVVDELDGPTVDACYDSIGSVKETIKAAVDALADKFCEERFMSGLANDSIMLDEDYTFPEEFNQPNPLTSYGQTLYEAEDGGINGLEVRMADLLSNSSRIVWWHRIVEQRKGEFCINGFIKHYPDFVALTTSGTVWLIETKGDDRKNPDSQAKLRLGTRWADMAGQKFKYFMVFDKSKLEEPNSYTMAEFSSSVLG